MISIVLGSVIWGVISMTFPRGWAYWLRISGVNTSYVEAIASISINVKLVYAACNSITMFLIVGPVLDNIPELLTGVIIFLALLFVFPVLIPKIAKK
jgi:hypothetical protein